MDKAITDKVASNPSLTSSINFFEDFTRTVQESQSKSKPPSSDPLQDLSGVEELRDFLHQNLGGLDKNRDGIVTPMETHAEYQKMKKDGRAGKVVDFLSNTGFEVYVEDLANDTSFFNSGITRNAIGKLNQSMVDYSQWREQQKAMVPKEYNLTSFGLSNFEKYDSDKNGKVSEKELRAALTASTVDSEKSGISELLSEYGRITEPAIKMPIVSPILNYLMPIQLTKGRLHDYLTDSYHAQVLEREGPAALFGAVRKYTGTYMMMSYYNDICLDSFRQFKAK